MQIDRIEETTDAQGRLECFVSGSTIDPLTQVAVPIAKWLTTLEYARYRAGESLSLILSGHAAQRVMAHRQELGQDTVQLMTLDAADRGVLLPQDLAFEYLTRSPSGEVVSTIVPSQTTARLPDGHEYLASFPSGV